MAAVLTPTHGSYFITADFAPLGFAGGDVAFCRHITEEAGVTAIPVTAFYDAPDPPRHYARFAFCKREEVLDEAVARLQRHFATRGSPDHPPGEGQGRPEALTAAG